MGMTFAQMHEKGNEVQKLIIDCVVSTSWFKKDIISNVSIKFFRRNGYYHSNDTFNSHAKTIINSFVLSQFEFLQRLGKLIFNKKTGNWFIILNAGFPTLREDYDGF